MSISRNRIKDNRAKIQKPVRTITWLPRSLKRSIAKANMQKAKIGQINKPQIGIRSGMAVKIPSKFQRSWRSWINPRKTA